MPDKRIQQALKELKQALNNHFGAKIKIYLFGSMARGDNSSNSDIDVLVLLPFEMGTNTQEEVINIAYDIELKYDVIFGLLVYSDKFWKSGRAKAMPLHQSVDKEGILI